MRMYPCIRLTVLSYVAFGLISSELTNNLTTSINNSNRLDNAESQLRLVADGSNKSDVWNSAQEESDGRHIDDIQWRPLIKLYLFILGADKKVSEIASLDDKMDLDERVDRICSSDKNCDWDVVTRLLDYFLDRYVHRYKRHDVWFARREKKINKLAKRLNISGNFENQFLLDTLNEMGSIPCVDCALNSKNQSSGNEVLQGPNSLNDDQPRNNKQRTEQNKIIEIRSNLRNDIHSSMTEPINKYTDDKNLSSDTLGNSLFMKYLLPFAIGRVADKAPITVKVGETNDEDDNSVFEVKRKINRNAPKLNSFDKADKHKHKITKILIQFFTLKKLARSSQNASPVFGTVNSTDNKMDLIHFDDSSLSMKSPIVSNSKTTTTPVEQTQSILKQIWLNNLEKLKNIQGRLFKKDEADQFFSLDKANFFSGETQIRKNPILRVLPNLIIYSNRMKIRSRRSLLKEFDRNEETKTAAEDEEAIGETAGDEANRDLRELMKSSKTIAARVGLEKKNLEERAKDLAAEIDRREVSMRSDASSPVEDNPVDSRNEGRIFVKRQAESAESIVPKKLDFDSNEDKIKIITIVAVVCIVVIVVFLVILLIVFFCLRRRETKKFAELKERTGLLGSKHKDGSLNTRTTGGSR